MLNRETLEILEGLAKHAGYTEIVQQIKNEFLSSKEKDLMHKRLFPNSRYTNVKTKLESMSANDLINCLESLNRLPYGPYDTVTQGWETITMSDWHMCVDLELVGRSNDSKAKFAGFYPHSTIDT